jgi:hypothetical protein
MPQLTGFYPTFIRDFFSASVGCFTLSNVGTVREWQVTFVGPIPILPEGECVVEDRISHA